MQIIFRIISYSFLVCQVAPQHMPHNLLSAQLVCPKDDLSKLNKVSEPAHSRYIKVDEMASSSRVNGFYRPRSALARALYEKQHNDRYLQELDQNEVSYFSAVYIFDTTTK